MSMGLTGGGGNITPAAADAPMPDMTPGAADTNYRYLSDPFFPRVAAYVNRISYVLTQGRPTAQIGVYIPSSSFWFNDPTANADFLAVVHQLLQHQRDLDYVDEGALTTGLKLQGRELVNASGQAYRAIIVPPVTAISQAALDHLHAFAQAGGKVIFLGHAPKLVMGKNFLTASGPADISWAVLETQAAITPKVLAALPAPDVALDQEASWLMYNHRQFKDAEVYFFFNEGSSPLDLHATVAAAGGAAQVWDGHTGKIETLAGVATAKGQTTLPLKLAPYETKLIMIGQAAPVASN
jgi:hypothetical protein